jgi:hypothetical protein
MTQQERPPVPLTKPPEVTSESEEGFHDLVFYIQEHKISTDGTQILRVSGTHNTRQLGLEVVLGPTWKAGSKNVPLATYSGDVLYHSVGKESNSFLEVLDDLYGTQLKPSAMVKEARFAGISLGGDPSHLVKEPVKIKLFFETGKDDEYAELFTNIDLATRRIEIREKDEEYRLPIVKALRMR